MEKKLTRSKEGKIIMGVCAGIAKHYDKDPMLIRGLFVVCSFLAAIGPIAYIILGFTLPEGE